MEVSTGTTFTWTNGTYFASLIQPDVAPLWASICGLELLLRLVSSQCTSPLFAPAFFLAVPALFYVIALPVAGSTIDDLRRAGWLFPEVKAAPFYAMSCMPCDPRPVFC